jgi:hypothetical protein
MLKLEIIALPQDMAPKHVIVIDEGDDAAHLGASK